MRWLTDLDLRSTGVAVDRTIEMRKLLLRMKNDRMSPVMMMVVGVMAGVHCAEQIELTGENVCTTKVSDCWLLG